MTILELNLQYNNIKNVGAMELWIAISNLTKLTHIVLDLEKNKVSGGFYHRISEYLA